MRGFSIVSIWVLTFVLLLKITSCAGDSSVVNPCCYFPCENSGVCVRFGTDQYECDCTRTGFYGKNCTIPEFWTRVRLMLTPDPSIIHFFLTHFHWFWDLVNNSFLRDLMIKLVLIVRVNIVPSPPTYNSKYGYLNWESYINRTYYSRILPPVPEDCPLPMGTKGKPVLPDSKLLTERLYKRTKFRPHPAGTNLMLAFMALHFTHQFFKTVREAGGGRSFTKALGHGIDGGHIYGGDLVRQLQLRLHKDGKLKYQLIKGEMYPPTVSDVPVYMLYPEDFPPEKRLVMGSEIFGTLPGLTMYATIWLREHNRVCDILKAEHPTWNDEQLFQTARLIIIGQTMRIILEEYVQHLSGYLLKLKFDPSLLFDVHFQYSNRITLEFCQLYHWHPLMPDSFLIDGDEISHSQFIFNTSLVMHYGIEKLVDAFSRQSAGQLCGGHNFHESLLIISESAIRGSRAARVQPLNAYRKKFNLRPYTSFNDFTDDDKMASDLEELYGDIDALEFYPGLLLEKRGCDVALGESIREIGLPFSLKVLLGNPICSPEYWKPSTFGGEIGFNIVKTATLKKLVCLNTKWCPYVAFHIPQNEEEAMQKTSTEL